MASELNKEEIRDEQYRQRIRHQFSPKFFDNTNKVVTLEVTVPKGGKVNSNYKVYRVKNSGTELAVSSGSFNRDQLNAGSFRETVVIGQEVASGFGAGEYFVRVYDNNKRDSWDSNTFELVVEDLDEAGWLY